MATEDQLILCSRLADLARVWPWVDGLAEVHAIPDDLRFVINLCLEESISNVIRHGHGGDCAHSILIHCSVQSTVSSEREAVFTIEDDAPHFNPLQVSRSVETAQTIDNLAEGGRGIELLRKFAGSLRYEPLSSGNRLTIGFSLPQTQQA